MLGVLVQIDAWDPVEGVPALIHAASHDDSAVCHLNGVTWWPSLVQLPKLRLDLFDGAFGDGITAPSSSLTMTTEPWPSYARYSFADARFRLWTGEVGAPWSAWAQRFDGRVSEQPEIASTIASLSFAVDDRWLDTPLLDLYAGTTGAEGEAAQKGVPKPLSIGAPRYVPGVLIDSINTILQLSSYGKIEGIDAAMEKLSRFGASAGDYPSFAALKAAPLPAGTWATCNAGGYVRHGAPLNGQSSYLVRGDSASGWDRLPGSVIRRIAEIAGAADKVSIESLTALNAARPWPISIWQADQITPRAIIQRIAASVNAVAGVSWLGKLFVVPIGINVPVATLRSDGAALPPVGEVSQVVAGQPFWRLALQAERTWQVHALSDVAFTAPLIDMGVYDPSTVYREGNIIRQAGSSWLYTNPTPSAGNLPPELPVETNAWWTVLAKAGSDGAPGAPGTNGTNGLNGSDGLPGGPGADGQTSYIHYAYANAPDGSVDFTTDAPGGRAYEGFYSDFVSPDSPNPGAYTWREYKGPPFGLAARGNAIVAGNQVIKYGGADLWDSDAYSTVGFRGGAITSFRCSPNYQMMAGLNTDPTTDASYTSLDYAFHVNGQGTAAIYESGVGIQTVGPYDQNSLFQIAYTGRAIRYLVNGQLVRETGVASDILFYFDSSIATPNGRLTDITFAGMGAAGNDGASGLNGSDGAPGGPGADGRTSYVHYAYANAPNGSIDFTLDQPNGRAYEGSYTDFTAADSGDPTTYTWREYTGPPFGLAVRGANVVAGNQVIKYGGSNDWDADAYSTVGFRGGAVTSFRMSPGYAIMAGLNTDPTTDASYASLDYAFYGRGDGYCDIYESGQGIQTVGPYDQNAVFQIIYNGKTVRYLLNGQLAREVGVAADILYYFDSSIATPSGRIMDLTFGGVGAAGNDGAPGSNGTNGAPGAPGADGLTSYQHTAFANSLNGVIEFTTGAPDGRAFIGTYSDFAAADSNDPAAYAWTAYKGPANFGLIGVGYGQVASNSLVNVVYTADWGQSGGNSTEGWRGGAQTSFKLDVGTFGGLNTDPTSDAAYASLDYAFHSSADGNTYIYENGNLIQGVGANGDYSRTYQIVYDNRQVVYYIDGAEARRINAPANLTLYFDAAMTNGPGNKVRNITFAAAGRAGSDGTNGLNGNDGLPGGPGANGQTTYTHYAYANSIDGSIDFALGSPNGRAYEGSYKDFTVSDSPNPAAYTWREYKGPPFGLTSRGQAAVAGNQVILTSDSGDWNSDAYSTVGYRGGAATSFRLTSSPDRNGEVMAGLNTDPTADASYFSLDYAFYRAGPHLYAYESGANAQGFGDYGDDAVLQIRYNNKTIDYLINGNLVRSVGVGANNLYYFDSSLKNTVSRIVDIAFTAGGPAGADGGPGAPGASALSMSVSKETFTVNADYNGNTKPGSLPQGGSTKVMYGNLDVTAQSSFGFASASGGIGVANDAAGNYQITAANNSGEAVWVCNYNGVELRKTLTINRVNDAPPAQTAVSTSGNDYLDVFSVTYRQDATMRTVSLQANGGGALNYSFFQEYLIPEAQQNPARYHTMAGQVMWRATGTSAWNYLGEVIGSQASQSGRVQEIPDEGPGQIQSSGQITGLTPGVYYDFTVQLRKYNNTTVGASGYGNIGLVLSQ